METIIVAVISLVSSLTVCLINNFFNQKSIKATNIEHLKELQDQQDKSMTLIEYKISELSKNVEKHNNVIERTYALEKDVDLLKEKITVANHRISDLESK